MQNLNLITLKEASSYLRVSHSTLYKLVEKGRIPATKVGGGWRFRKESLDHWLNRFSQSNYTVLIVDDDEVIRETIKTIVTREGYRAAAVESGEKALEEIQKKHYDLIFLDLVLPGISGLEVIKHLKTIGEKTLVTVITGYGDDPIAMEAMSLGPILMIRKPFRIEDIVQVLNMVMATRF